MIFQNAFMLSPFLNASMLSPFLNALSLNTLILNVFRPKRVKKVGTKIAFRNAFRI